MKLFLALLLLGGLTAAAVLVPVSGETAWQHAERKGWPLAAAHAFVRTANAGAHWVAVTLQGHPAAPPPPSRGPRRRLARLPSPAATAASSGPGRAGSSSAPPAGPGRVSSSAPSAGHAPAAAPWAPLPASSRGAPPATLARASPGAPPTTLSRGASGAPAGTLARPASGEAPSPGTRDRIVAATPAEHLDGPDRAALDKLITARGGR